MAEARDTLHNPDVTLCVLAGGEGRRMGGRDKGLVAWHGRPLVAHVLARLAPQCGAVMVSANRHLPDYQALLADAIGQQSACAQGDGLTVQVDDPDLPAASGPLAGIVTLGRRLHTEWMLVAPCDSPRLPEDLVARLLAAAASGSVEPMSGPADVIVPSTLDAQGTARHHWVCALMHRRSLPELSRQFDSGERKVGRWVQSLRWRDVFFSEADAFANINALESLHVNR